MFKIQIGNTNKFVRDGITRAVMLFDTLEHAQKWADTMHRDSVLNASAWNRTRRTIYTVVAA